jgi:nucleoside-diphosphate-sugar epimerase
MRVFVTGATGFVGTAVVRELLSAGHEVTGMARSDASAAALEAVGVAVHRGTLEDVEGLRAAATATDAVIHTAFLHDFTDFAHSVAVDLRAVEAFGEALAGTDRALVITSGTPARPGLLAGEDSAPEPDTPAAARFAAEEAALAAPGVRSCVIRLPRSVHGEGDLHGFIPRLIATARERGVSAYPDDGANRWPAVHRLDAARLYRLAVEEAPAGSRLHAVGDEGVPVRAIAEHIGTRLGLPIASVPAEHAVERFGWLGPIFAMDQPASSAVTRKLLDWHPVEAGLLDDIDAGHYVAGERR